MDVDQPPIEPTTDKDMTIGNAADEAPIEKIVTGVPPIAPPVEQEMAAQGQEMAAQGTLSERQEDAPPDQSVVTKPANVGARTSARTAGRAAAKSSVASKSKAKQKATRQKVVLPAYIAEVQPMFASVDAPLWTSLVQKFVDFESSRKFTEGRLQVGHRPEVVTKWTAARRPHYADGVLPKTMPATFQLVQDAFWVWWRFLQPQWRGVGSGNRKDDISKAPLTDADRQDAEDAWDRLDVSGSLGFMNIMAYLCMWGKKVRKEQAGESAWLDAIQDVAWVLENMTAGRR